MNTSSLSLAVRTGMLLMVALLVTMSASAAARRYAKISRAWV